MISYTVHHWKAFTAREGDARREAIVWTCPALAARIQRPGFTSLNPHQHLWQLRLWRGERRSRPCPHPCAGMCSAMLFLLWFLTLNINENSVHNYATLSTLHGLNSLHNLIYQALLVLNIDQCCSWVIYGIGYISAIYSVRWKTKIAAIL